MLITGTGMRSRVSVDLDRLPSSSSPSCFSIFILVTELGLNRTVFVPFVPLFWDREVDEASIE